MAAQLREEGNRDSDIESVGGARVHSLGLLNKNTLMIFCFCSVDHHTRLCPQLQNVSCRHSRISCTHLGELQDFTHCCH